MYKIKEKISNKTLIHSSLGEFKKGDKMNSWRPSKGRHGEENIRRLQRLGIKYNIVEQYPNGVRLGNMPSHMEGRRRKGTFHSWFPKSWTRKTIKDAGERIINSVPYKLPDDMDMFGTHKKVKVMIKRRKGRPTTIFPYYKQSGGKKNVLKKAAHTRIF